MPLDVLRQRSQTKAAQPGSIGSQNRGEAVEEDGRDGDGVVHSGGDETRDDGGLQGAEAAGGGAAPARAEPMR
jgi:hypothetical protein